MSYMGSVGKIMGGYGVEEMWCDVFAKKAVVHMANGHFYSMFKLKTSLLVQKFERFVSEGYFTVRRSDKFWIVVWTDLTIQQVLMRFRNLSYSVVAHRSCTMPGCLQVMEAVEAFAGVTGESSEQHISLSKSWHTRAPKSAGRHGHLGGVDKKLTDKEERARLRVAKEENRRIKYVSASKSSALYEPLQEDSSSNSSENIDSKDFPTLIGSSEPGTSKSAMRKDFITPKLVAALGRCQLSMRDSMFIFEATIDALGCNIDEFPISKFSIQRIRTEKLKERAENIKIDFQNEVPDVMTLHWDGKLLSALSARK
ncbi:hypothetical protein AVEN_78224-1 [Araneus ventricosus]|uniref:Uncharacterized protein n=1 Tax=Araneus ventricosus TaxID=182803 RepID=A0A4Y2LK58_ARAVE|nr:hypothetical protein AVEN_78224-1 [Araneus ventricosus]